MTTNQAGPTCPRCHHEHPAEPWPAACDECGVALPARPRPARRKQAPVRLILVVASVVLALAVSAVAASAFRTVVLSLPAPPTAEGPTPPTGPGTPPVPAPPPAGASLFDRLRAADAAERAEAARDLARRPAEDDRREQVRAALRPLLKDDSEVVRRSAVLALAAWAGPEDVPALVELLKADWVSDSRAALVRALGRLADARAAAALAELLSGYGDADAAAEALVAIGPGAEKAVVPVLFHPDEKARARAARVLKALGTKPAVITTGALRELDGHPERAREALAWLAKAPPSSAEREAVTARLAGLMGPGDETTRAAAAAAFGAWAGPEQVNTLWRCLRDESAGVRQPAVAALGRLKDRRTLPSLAAHLSVAEDRPVTVKALVAFGPAAESDALLQLNALNGGTRAAACEVLQAVGTTKSKTVLRALISDPDPGVAAAARTALQGVLSRP